VSKHWDLVFNVVLSLAQHKTSCNDAVFTVFLYRCTLFLWGGCWWVSPSLLAGQEAHTYMVTQMQSTSQEWPERSVKFLLPMVCTFQSTQHIFPALY